ncbi:MAG: Por secretion system C-terminal sorting protein, partial [Bacteroidetes bacterium]|nr:Por secretion system C-terminal sorting protein [Bacteroidota bacterium]
VSMLAPSLGAAQIWNPGFEVWPDANPEGWTTSNIPTIVTPVTASNNAHGGSFAARGEVEFAANTVWPANLQSIFAHTQVPERFQAYYQFAPQGGDVLAVAVIFYSDFFPIAAADTEIVVPAGSYTLLDLPIEEYLSGTPDQAYIFFTIIGTGTEGMPTVGSTYLVDDLAFVGSLSSVRVDGTVPATFELNQNYPNPFNPSTTIEYALPEASQVRLEVFNAIGERVATLVDGRQDAGSYRSTFDASSLPSGVYLYRLTAGANVSVKRMILMK